MPECPFCELVAGRDGELVALRTENAIVVPVPFQRRNNQGHVLVLPHAHVTRLIDASPELLQELYVTAARVGSAAREAFGATGVTLLQNDEAPDQMLYHLHLHVIPRRRDDAFRIPEPDKEAIGLAERREQARLLRQALAR